MKKILPFVIVLSFVASISYSQSVKTNTKAAVSPDPNLKVLYVLKVDNLKAEIPSGADDESIFKLIDPNGIESVNILKGKSAEEEYGTKASGGAVIIQFKKEIYDKLPKELKDKFVEG